jgi:hypothetical protein
MRSLFVPAEKEEKDRTPRPTLSPRLRQLIIDLKAEYPPLTSWGVAPRWNHAAGATILVPQWLPYRSLCQADAQ